MPSSPEIPWTPDLETLVREMGERASVLRILHRIEAARMAKFDAIIVVPSIVIQVVVAGIQGSPQENWEAPTAFLIACNLSSAALFSLSKYLRFSEKHSEHLLTSLAYGKLYRRISTELATSREHRTEAHTILKIVRETFDNIHDRAPLIPRHTIQNYMRTFDNTENIALPDVCNGLKRIKISKLGQAPQAFVSAIKDENDNENDHENKDVHQQAR